MGPCYREDRKTGNLTPTPCWKAWVTYPFDVLFGYSGLYEALRHGGWEVWKYIGLLVYCVGFVAIPAVMYENGWVHWWSALGFVAVWLGLLVALMWGEDDPGGL